MEQGNRRDAGARTWVSGSSGRESASPAMVTREPQGELGARGLGRDRLLVAVDAARGDQGRSNGCAGLGRSLSRITHEQRGRWRRSPIDSTTAGVSGFSSVSPSPERQVGSSLRRSVCGDRKVVVHPAFARMKPCGGACGGPWRRQRAVRSGKGSSSCQGAAGRSLQGSSRARVMLRPRRARAGASDNGSVEAGASE